MSARLILALAAVLVLFGCAASEAPPPVPALGPPFPAPLIGPAPPPLSYAEPVRPFSRRYSAKRYAPKCQIRTHTTINKAGQKRTARYLVCLK